MKDMKLSKLVIVLLGIILLAGISAISYAAIPETMSYQGYLTDSGGVAVNVPVNITFRIYGVDIGGTALWTETQSVSVSNGVYSVQLGSVSTLTSLTFDVPYWLGVEVETDGEMDPRQPFDSVPFAVISAMSEFATSAESATSADFATSVADGSVNDNSITGTISSSKIEYSGLNADFIDDMDSTDFANVSHVHGSADITQGSGSTLDADLLDGQDSADFANASHSHGSADITPPLSFLSDNGITIQTTSTHINGTGIRGEGNFMGVAGYTQGDTGVGVYGLSGTTGANYGVFGYSRSPDGHGVHGMNDAGGYAGYFDGPVASTGALTANSFSGSGANITNLNASNIMTGIVADSRLSANIDLLNADQFVTGVKNFAPAVGTVPFTVDVSKTGPVANLNADLLDGQHSSDIIAAVADADQTVTGVKNFAPSTGTIPFSVDASKTGPVTNLNADLLDGQHSSDIIAAAVDEVRTAISACGTIISSGSYYVTADLSATGHCIEVTADNVTIDLMGFTLIGDGLGADYGVSINNVSNVEVKNGTVTNFSYGIRAHHSSGTKNSNRMINVRAVANTDYGIALSGYGNLVKDCTASENGTGISTGQGSTVINNTAYNNQGIGIIADQASTVTINTVSYNQGTGIHASSFSTVTNNTVFYNELYGISVNGGSTVIGNTIAYNNQADSTSSGGLNINSGCYVKGNTLINNLQRNISVALWNNIIEENLVTRSTLGIYFQSSGNFYANNRASDNTTNYAGTLPTGSGDGGGNVSF